MHRVPDEFDLVETQNRANSQGKLCLSSANERRSSGYVVAARLDWLRERLSERDWAVIRETLDSVVHNVWLRAKGQGVRFRTVGIKIRFEGFVTHMRERTLPTFIVDEEVMRAKS